MRPPHAPTVGSEGPWSDGPDPAKLARVPDDSLPPGTRVCNAVPPKAACERFGSPLYFESLPKLTELLLSDDDRIQQIRSVIEEHMQELETVVLDAMRGHTTIQTRSSRIWRREC